MKEIHKRWDRLNRRFGKITEGRTFLKKLAHYEKPIDTEAATPYSRQSKLDRSA